MVRRDLRVERRVVVSVVRVVVVVVRAVRASGVRREESCWGW